MNPPTPPRLATALLRWLLGPEDAEFVLGDLAEDFTTIEATSGPRAARWWYWRQLAGTARARVTFAGTAEVWSRDVRHAARALVRAPGYAVVAVVTLALGIGGAATIGAIAVSVLSPLPYPDSDDLVAVWETRNDVQRAVSPANYIDWRQRSRTFDGLAAHTVDRVSITLGDGATREPVAVVSSNFFHVLGEAPSWGRAFDPTFDASFAEREVVLEQGAAERAFGSAAEAVGQSLRVDDLVYTVVGVMSTGFGYPETGLFGWTRSPTEAPEIRNLPPDINLTEVRDAWYFDVVGRVRGERSVADGRADLEAVAAQLAVEYPETNAESGVLVVPLLDQTVADFDRTLWALALAVALVLTASLFNVLHLTRARAEGRRADAAVRLSLGASRARLARSFAVEGWIVGLAATTVGLGLATLALSVSTALLAEAVPRAHEIELTAVSAWSAMLLGLLGGSVLGRASLSVAAPKRDLRSSLTRARAGRSLVAVQVAVSIAVLTGTALLARSFAELGRVDLGFRSDGLATMRISIPDAPTRSYAERLALYRDVVSAVERSPGIAAVTLGSDLPLRMGMGAGVRIEGVTTSEDPPNSGWQPVEPSYFGTLGMSLLEGRELQSSDRAGTVDVAVVNEAFVRDVLDGRPALGSRVTMGLDGHDRPLEIVGVVADTRTRGPAQPAGAVLYRPLDQTLRYAAGSVVLAARVSGQTGLQDVRAVVRNAAPSLPVYDERTGSALMRPFRAGQALLLTIMGVFAGTAVSIGLVGVYGVGIHAVRRARRDIGIRLALGATGGQMTKSVITDGMRSALFGLPVGLVLAYGVGRSVSNQLFATSATDPVSLIGVALAVLGLTAIAFWAPARVAARVDPARAMRDG
ncbi:MAG: FtsX-like permease family protein [Gemmatimonadota bacterium]